MTAITSNYHLSAWQDGIIVSNPILQDTTAVEIYQGSLANFDATNKTAVKNATNTNGEIFAGVPFERKTGDVGAAGVGSTEVRNRKKGIVRVKTASGAGANDPDAVGATDAPGTVLYIVDNISVGKSGGDGSTCYVQCGELVKYVSADEVYMKIDGYAK